jgi:hypothetical protein
LLADKAVLVGGAVEDEAAGQTSAEAHVSGPSHRDWQCHSGIDRGPSPAVGNAQNPRIFMAGSLLHQRF